MRRFELIEGTSKKFWEILVEGVSVTTRYGRIGTAGQTTAKHEVSAAAAHKLHDKLVSEKTKKGYVEAGAAAVKSKQKAKSGDDVEARLDTKLPKGKAKAPPSWLGSKLIYIDTLAASADLVVGGCTNNSVVVLWSARKGSKTLGHEILGNPIAFGGIATLPDDRFVAATGSYSDAPKPVSRVAVYDLDGNVLGTPRSEKGHTYGVTATSADGELLAVESGPSGKMRISIWRTTDFLAGKPALHEVEGAAHGLTFTPNGASLLILFENKIQILDVGTGKRQKIAVKLDGTMAQISVSATGLACASSGSAATVFTLRGERRFGWTSLGGVKTTKMVAEHAMVAAEGQVIVTHGALRSHYDNSEHRKVTFPKPGMENGFVAVFDDAGKLLRWAPRAKNKAVRAMALVAGTAVALGQDGGLELAPWPVA